MLGTVGGAIAGVWLAALEARSINDFISSASFGAFYGAFIGFDALCRVGLATATLFALLKITVIKRFRYLPYICSIVVLIIYYAWMFSRPVYSLYGLHISLALAIVVALSLFGASYRIVTVDSRSKTKAKRSE